MGVEREGRLHALELGDSSRLLTLRLHSLLRDGIQKIEKSRHHIGNIAPVNRNWNRFRHSCLVQLDGRGLHIGELVHVWHVPQQTLLQTVSPCLGNTRCHTLPRASRLSQEGKN